MRQERGRQRVMMLVAMLSTLVAAGCGSDATRPTDNPPPDTTTEPPPPPPPAGLSLTLSWATYLGGANFEEAREPKVLPGGRVLFSARTLSTNLPTTPGAFQPTFGGGNSDTYLAILSADGRTLEAATYFGGSGMERPAYGMALTSNGDIVFTSGTGSRDLPTTPGAYLEQNTSPVDAGYVCRVSGTLSVIRWCTYTVLWPRGGLTLTPNDEVIVAGRASNGSTFTTTAGAYQTTQRGFDDAAILRLTADGRSAVFSTRLGGTGTELGEVALSATWAGGDIVISGASQSRDFPVTSGSPSHTPRDFFVARLSGDGSQLLSSTLLGGSGQDSPAHPDARLPDGSIIVAGITDSPDIPATLGTWSGQSDLLITKYDPTTGAFAWTQYIGGSADDRVIGRTVDAAGRIIIVGESNSANFPVSANAMQKTKAGGRDGVILVLDASGAVLYSTYFGGSGDDWIRGVATAPDGTVFIAGSTTSSNLPGTAGVFQPTRGGAEDAFVARLRLSTGG